MNASSTCPVHTHEDLLVWQLAMDLVEEVYRHTRGFPVEERYGLNTQLRRAAVSIPSNIAEGAGRRSHKDFLQFLAIARGSLAELQTQIKLAERLGYLRPENSLHDQSARVFQLLNALMSKLELSL